MRAPNLQVARLDAAQYAISARGFNDLIANKLRSEYRRAVLVRARWSR